MSSSPPADPTASGRWRRPSSWSLRAQLTAALVVLTTVVCVLFGVVTTTVVNQLQMDRLNSQLTEAANRARGGQHPPDPLGIGGRPPRGPVPDTGQAAGTLLGRIVDGEVTDARMRDPVTNEQEDLPSAQFDVLKQLPADGRKYTRDLGSFGAYRLVAIRAGDGDVVLITGLPMAPVYATRDRLIAVEILVGLIAALLAALLGTAIVRRTLRPLHRVAATARRVAELPLDRGEVALSVRVPDVDPRTEVGQVGAALNRMLGHVAAALAARQASEMRVRHFVADASHELRTPLAAIRGYAELTGRYGDAVPPDVAHAMRRVHSETARMTTLVEDLLLLARLDSGRPLEREQVDLSRLVIDAVGDAHVAARDHEWRLDLPEEPVTVTGDPARLHQVLANLLANARVHTPPGTVVVTRLAVAGAEARLSVVDNGPGIPAELQPEVFDRFARGDSSRSRAAGSTGLGLAIVAAVVEAHGGSVEVTSRPGYTGFTVRLPSHAPVDEPPATDGRSEPMASGQSHRSG
ncbi:HAMP domain-containing histidine kinase [Planosporangium thailandense]|uniref:histidine kinase n=1 Tax=Planosporangium thailandense TaxID=765197 RepID=A0ABX0XZH5_9ACTN|nr:HAMP domain-containing sensor histidine kinase [Planosporangium thailandense]NJC71302.1 HAMP domain-containing histidine kinase [Planosporangium thailandense]